MKTGQVAFEKGETYDIEKKGINCYKTISNIGNHELDEEDINYYFQPLKELAQTPKHYYNSKEFQQLAFQTALAKSIIASQFALHNNEILKHTQYFKADVKKYGKPFILALIRAELKEFDKVDNVDSKRVSEIFESLDKVLQTLSKAIFADWQQLDGIIKAYAKNPEKMSELAKKILK
jgi:hypothetical protein